MGREIVLGGDQSWQRFVVAEVGRSKALFG